MRDVTTELEHAAARHAASVSPPAFETLVAVRRRRDRRRRAILAGVIGVAFVAGGTTAAEQLGDHEDTLQSGESPSATAEPTRSASTLTNAAVPPEFRGACGHPGARVEVQELRVTVRHVDCDLTGVFLLRRAGGGGCEVPLPDTSCANSAGVTVHVDGTTQDVTFTQEEEHGNA
jgi:hypothetical protein